MQKCDMQMNTCTLVEKHFSDVFISVLTDGISVDMLAVSPKPLLV